MSKRIATRKLNKRDMTQSFVEANNLNTMKHARKIRILHVEAWVDVDVRREGERKK